MIWWLVPVGVLLVGAIPVLVMVRRVAGEARALQHTISRLGEFREPLDDLRMRVSVLELPKPPTRRAP